VRWAWALLLVGCHPVEPFPGLELGMDTQARVVAFRRGEQVELHAGAAGLGSFSVEPFDEMIVLGYPRTLGELGMKPGLLAITGTPPFHPLFRSRDVHGLVPGEAAWRRLDALPDWLAAVRLLGELGPIACASAGGCYADDEGLAIGACTVPCADATLVVAPPKPVDMTPCPTGWLIDRRGEDKLCRPPPRVDCPEGQVQWIDRSDCEPIAGECPADGWPEVAADWWVDPDAVGGDGSKARPLATVSQTLDVALAGQTIALRAGRHPIDALQFISSVNLVGACAGSSGTTLFGSPLIVVGTATISRLRFEQSVSGALVVQDEAKLRLDSVELEGNGAFPALVVQGELVGSRIVSRRQASTVWRPVTGGALQIERWSIADHGKEALLVAGDAPVILRDGWSDGGLTIGIDGRGLVNADVELSRIAVTRHMYSGIELARSSAVVEHVIVEDIEQGPGVGEGFYATGGSLQIRGVSVARARLSGFWFFGGDVTGSDLWVEDIEQATAGIYLQYAPAETRWRTRLERIAVERSQRGMRIVDGGLIDLFDVRADGGEFGIVLDDTGAVPLQDVQITLGLKRARFSAMSGAGFRQDFASSRVDYADIEVVDSNAGLELIGGVADLKRLKVSHGVTPRGSAPGLVGGVSLALSLVGFEISGHEVGIDLASGDFDLTDGLIRDCQTGVEATRAGVAAGFRRVTFDGVPTPIVERDQ
jgi:hypothetical protein